MTQILPATPAGWALLGLGAAGAAGLTVALWPARPRTRVARAAASQIGDTDAARYWRDVLPGTPPSGYPKDWCGAFALWALHQAGLGLELSWVIGEGFLDRLHTTGTPELGDIAYFTNNQHHAVVVGIDPSARTVTLVNGNGTGGAVSASTAPWSSVAGFYSIESLLSTAESDWTLAWLLGGAGVTGALAWKLLPSGSAR